MPGRCSSLANETPKSTTSQRRAGARRRGRRAKGSCRSRRRRRAARTRARRVHRPSISARHRSRGRCDTSPARDRFARCRRHGAASAGRRRRCPRSGPSTLAAPTARTRIGRCRGRRPARASRRGSRQSPRRGPIAPAGAAIAADSAVNSASGVTLDARGREIGGGKCGAGRMMPAVDADADRRRRAPAASPSIRMPASLRRRSEHVIRPFQRQSLRERWDTRRRSHHAARAPRRTTAAARDPAAPASVSSRRGVEIAGLRRPGAAAPAAAGGLRCGGDPQRPALAGARARQRFGVGRADASRERTARRPPRPRDRSLSSEQRLGRRARGCVDQRAG